MTARRILAISQTCLDLESLTHWYCQHLGFRKLTSQRLQGSWVKDLFGCEDHMIIDRALLELGEEQLQLWQWQSKSATQQADPVSRAMPADSRSNDRWFQHICMVTNNLSSVYTDDLRKSSEAISTAIQTLPNWNAAAAGIQAVKLKDPLGHPLELLQFPDDKGNQRWHGLATDLGRPLGIDHTAIGISNTRNSVVFYRDLLGLVVGGTSHNHGKEQDGLDGLSEIQVEITSFRPTGQPLGIELLNYLQPEGGRERSNPRPTDINEWRIIIDCENLDELHAVMKGSELVNSCGPVVDVQQEFCGRPRGFVVRDPDQHALVLVGE